MIEIPLSHGLVAKIDDADYEKVSQFQWFAYRIAGTSHTGKTYLYGYKPGRKQWVEKGKFKKVWLYNFIMNPPEGMFVDHINGDVLDNRRENLRIVSHAQNTLNRGKRSNGKTSRYLGVCKKASKKKFQASIVFQGKNINLGFFENEDDAALAYNKKAQELFGEYARLNVIGEASV